MAYAEVYAARQLESEQDFWFAVLGGAASLALPCRFRCVPM
jgi:hypothetical protein